MNRRGFFKALFGAGTACVLPRVVDVTPEEERIPGVITTDTPLTDKQLEWLRKELTISICVPPAKPLIWKSTPIHLDPAWTPDETAIVILNNNSSVAGLIHNIGD